MCHELDQVSLLMKINNSSMFCILFKNTKDKDKLEDKSKSLGHFSVKVLPLKGQHIRLE